MTASFTSMWWCILVIPLLSSVLGQPQVDIDSGTLQGATVETHYPDGNGGNISVNAFHGIPYSVPPVGDLRFRVTTRNEPWEGVYEATTLATACIQNVGGWLWITHPGWQRHDEDCLYLDVFTPENMQPDTPYPVMVFFHGGAYQSGATIQYPGHHYAARDVVMVVVNYRLGIFGFVSTDDSTAPGNYGLYDQRLSLEWVQENIASFGGDPDRVTIFGQSAGAGSVAMHMVSPLSQGLFHQAIEESGTDFSFWSFNWPASQPETYGMGVAEELGCDTTDTETWIACLRESDPWLMLNASNPLECNPGHFCLGFAPVVDGTFVPDIPHNMRRNGQVASIPLMTGYLTEDGALYTLAYIPEAMDGGFYRDEFQYHLREDLLGMWAPQFDEKTNEDAFQALDWYYAPWPYTNDTEMNRQAFNKMVTDGAFADPADMQARANSEGPGGTDGAPTYLYTFGYRSNVTYGGLLNGTAWMKVFHSAELPYVFGWPLLQLSDDVRRNTRILIDLAPWNDDDIAYAEFTIDLWANFAKFGNPTPEPVENPPFGNQPFTFEAYSAPDEQFNTGYLGEIIENRDAFNQQRKAMWDYYLAYILERDFYSTGVKKGKTMTSNWVNSFPDPSQLQEWADRYE